MIPEAITCLFKKAHDASPPPLEGKPSDNDLLAIQETFLPLLMVIPYNQLNGFHSLMTSLTKAVKYDADQGHLLLYNKMVAKDATIVICARAEAAHKSQLNDYASYEAAK